MASQAVEAARPLARWTQTNVNATITEKTLALRQASQLFRPEKAAGTDIPSAPTEGACLAFQSLYSY